MKVTDLNIKDVNYIVDNLWDRGRKEIEIFGHTVERFRAFCKLMIGEPFCSIICDDALNPCAVLILRPMGYGKWDVVFQATEEGFDKVWFSLIRFLKAFSNVIIEDNDWTLQIQSALTHERTHDWITAMGFSWEKTEGPVTTYIKKAVNS